MLNSVNRYRDRNQSATNYIDWHTHLKIKTKLEANSQIKNG